MADGARQGRQGPHGAGHGSTRGRAQAIPDQSELPPLPHAGDRTPAVLPLVGPPEFLSRQAVYDLVKEVLAAAAKRVRALGPENEAAAEHLERASPHWLRHTAGSDLARTVGVVAMRDTLGHANISTTNIYVHVEDEKRHDAINERHAIAWSS